MHGWGGDLERCVASKVMARLVRCPTWSLMLGWIRKASSSARWRAVSGSPCPWWSVVQQSSYGASDVCTALTATDEMGVKGQQRVPRVARLAVSELSNHLGSHSAPGACKWLCVDSSFFPLGFFGGRSLVGKTNRTAGNICKSPWRRTSEGMVDVKLKV